MQEKLEKDFYEELTRLSIDKKANCIYRISERDSKKGLRVIVYNLETGLLREYKCRI